MGYRDMFAPDSGRAREWIYDHKVFSTHIPLGEVNLGLSKDADILEVRLKLERPFYDVRDTRIYPAGALVNGLPITEVVVDQRSRRQDEMQGVRESTEQEGHIVHTKAPLLRETKDIIADYFRSAAGCFPEQRREIEEIARRLKGIQDILLNRYILEAGLLIG